MKSATVLAIVALAVFGVLHTEARALFEPELPEDGADSTEVGPLQREKRFAMFFSMISYENKLCRYDEHHNGTCMEASECTKHKGKMMPGNTCGRSQGANLGVCCLVSDTCGDTASKRNNTLFVNPDFPRNTTTPQTCDLIVPVETECYIRLDFVHFSVYEPVRGSCLVDQIFIPELARTVPMVCGNNTGSHMYLDVRGRKQITIRTNLGEWGGPRRWKIRIVRIECGTFSEPPTGCLQFFREPNGFIRSFNFHESAPEKSSLITGLDYTICISRAVNKCFAQWSAPFFSMTPANKTAGALAGDSCLGKAKLIIPEGQDYSYRNVSYDRYCGEIFSALPGSPNSTFVYTSSFPFQVRVSTPRAYTEENLGKGFLLRYQQLQCLDLPVHRSADSVDDEAVPAAELAGGSLPQWPVLSGDDVPTSSSTPDSPTIR